MKLILFVLFQAAWFGIILGGSLWALAITPIYVALLQFLAKPKPRFWLDVLTLALMGFSVDALLTFLGIYQFPEGYPPIWLGCLWLVFIPIVPLALDWLLEKPPYWAALMGAIGGPLSYQAGAVLGPISIHSHFFMVETAVAWILIMLVLWKLYPLMKQRLSS